MKVFVINSGSSSVKFQLFEMDNEEVIIRGIAQKIGLADSFISHTLCATGKKKKTKIHMPDHKHAIDAIIALLMKSGAITQKDDIDAIGHRLVHAGEHYHSSVVVTEDVLERMTECNDLAPLHNPPNILGVRTCQTIFPNAFQAGCFDTAFHQTMPDYSYIYPIDYTMYEKYKVRRYGFHGTSHQFVSEEAAKTLQKPVESLKIITCHLGNGCSLAAIKNGKSLDTTMGLTPLEGVMMGTRSGDVDPGLVFFLEEKEGGSVESVKRLLNRNSGLKGVSGVSNDMRDVGEARDNGNDRARLAIDIFIYRLTKQIGAYAAAMGGVDTIVFTGGIGENNPEIRSRVLANFAFLGIKLNQEKNDAIYGERAIISTPYSAASVLVVPTDEELVIARETARLKLKQNPRKEEVL